MKNSIALVCAILMMVASSTALSRDSFHYVYGHAFIKSSIGTLYLSNHTRVERSGDYTVHGKDENDWKRALYARGVDPLDLDVAQVGAHNNFNSLDEAEEALQREISSRRRDGWKVIVVQW